MGKEEELFGATLDTVKVVIHVEETNSQRKAGDDDTVHLPGGVGIEGDGRDEGNLNDGKLGERRHGEALLDGVDFPKREFDGALAVCIATEEEFEKLKER